MANFKKQMLHCGRYHSSDGVVEVTPQRLKHWESEFKRLATNGNVVPIDWDHDDDPLKAHPLSLDEWRSKKRSAKNTVGTLKDFLVNDDGKSATLVLSVNRTAAAEAADANDVFVSPVIFESWRDGKNNSYRDVITHVDIVNHPVDSSQGPFQRCGLRMGLDTGHPRIFRLGAKEDDMADSAVLDDEDLDLEDEASADEEDQDGDGVTAMGEDEAGDESFEAVADPVDGMADDLAADIAAPVVRDDQALVNQVMEDLRAVGFAPPEGVDPLSDPLGFLSQLGAVLRQVLLTEEGGDESAEAPTDDLGEPEDTSGDDGMYDDADLEAREPAYASMSLKAPEVKAMAIKVQSLENKLNAAHAQLVKEGKQRLGGHLKSLLNSGRCTVAEYNEQIAGLKACRMSLGNNGSLNRTDLHTWIQARLSLPKGAAQPGAKRLSQATSRPQPAVADDGNVTAEKVESHMADLKKRFPNQYK